MEENKTNSTIPYNQNLVSSEVHHVDISLAEFISVCIYLAEECGRIIHKVVESGAL